MSPHRTHNNAGKRAHAVILKRDVESSKEAKKTIEEEAAPTTDGGQGVQGQHGQHGVEVESGNEQRAQVCTQSKNTADKDNDNNNKKAAGTEGRKNRAYVSAVAVGAGERSLPRVRPAACRL